jgi:hypothetical protein
MRFAAARDVPDVLGFADYVYRPDLTLPLVRERIVADLLFVDHRRFPLPKEDGSTRGLTVLSPVAELALRTFVGRCGSAISAAIDERHVLNGLIRKPGPGWFSADFREQYRRRRELQRSYYGADATQAVGFLDVENFFPSCCHAWLGAKLEEIRAPRGAAEVLVAMLSNLFPTSLGLPIGFEGSGPLANLFLLPLDAALVAEGMDFVRWTDDVDVFLTDADRGSDLIELAGDKLREAHLRLNNKKSCVMAKGVAAENRLLDPSRDSVLGDDAVDNVKARLEMQLWMNEWGSPDVLRPAHVRSYLGILRADGNPGALEFLAEFPNWIDREPRAVGDYVSALTRYAEARSSIDPDWLLDRAIGRAPTPDTEAGQLHMCRALVGLRLGSARAARLLDFALRPDIVLGHSVLGAWAVRAWSASQGWNKTTAMNVIDAIAHASYRRAAVVGFSERRPASENALRNRARADPEIAPAIEFALSA